MDTFEVRPLLIEAGLAVLLVVAIIVAPPLVRRASRNIKKAAKQIGVVLSDEFYANQVA